MPYDDRAIWVPLPEQDRGTTINDIITTAVKRAAELDRYVCVEINGITALANPRSDATKLGDAYMDVWEMRMSGKEPVAPISEDQRPSAVEETPEPQPDPITYHSDTHRTAPCDRCAEPMEQMRVELLGTWLPFICPACERKADQEQAIAAAKGIQKVRNRTVAEEIPPAYLLLSDALWLATSNSPQKTPGSSAENPFPQHQSQHRRFPTAAWARLRHWYPKGHGDEEPAGEGILRIERGRGLILCGDTGRYKTTIACALLARAHRVLGMSICYLNAAEYGEAVQDRQAWKDDPQLRARSRAKIDTAKRAGLLLIDDLGKEQSTPTIYKQLCHLIEERTSNLRPTIVTTQLPAEDFARILGAQDAYTGRALIRRLQDYCDLIVFS